MSEYVTLPRADVEIVTQIANRNEQSAAGDRLAVMLSSLSASIPAEIGELVERLENDRPTNMVSVLSIHLEAASLIQSQAARIAELEVGLRPFAQRCDEAVRPDDSDNDGVTVKTKHLRTARALLNRRAVG